jgi:hypothetical protein
LYRDGAECKHPANTDWYGYTVMAKAPIAFNAVICVVVGRLEKYGPLNTPPPNNAPVYCTASVNVNTWGLCYDAAYWYYNTRDMSTDTTAFEINFAKYISPADPGTRQANCFVEYVERYYLFRIRASRNIDEGEKICIGSVATGRFYVKQDHIVGRHDTVVNRMLRDVRDSQEPRAVSK